MTITPERLAALRAERDAEQARRQQAVNEHARRLASLRETGREMAATSLTYAQLMALQSVHGCLRMQQGRGGGSLYYSWLHPIFGTQGCQALGINSDAEALAFLEGVVEVAALV